MKPFFYRLVGLLAVLGLLIGSVEAAHDRVHLHADEESPSTLPDDPGEHAPDRHGASECVHCVHVAPLTLADQRGGNGARRLATMPGGWVHMLTANWKHPPPQRPPIR